MIDVGEGDAFLIQTPEKETILIDTGNPVSGHKVAQYLKDQKIKKIDHLILSHPDQDHIGGTFFVMQMFDVEKTYDNGEDLSRYVKKSDFYYWYDQLARDPEKYHLSRKGDLILLKKGLFEVLWPPTPMAHNWFNPNSLVMMFDYEGFKILFMGDFLDFTEEELLKEQISVKANILKAGHHGSNDTSTDPFLKRVSPELVLISANHTRRDYPGEKMLERLKTKNIRYLTTQKNGDTVVLIKPTKKRKKLKIITAK